MFTDFQKAKTPFSLQLAKAVSATQSYMQSYGNAAVKISAAWALALFFDSEPLPLSEL
jgi:hypothetical protein